MSFWRKKQIDELESKDIAPLEEPEKKDEIDHENAAYSIGVNEAGNVQFNLRMQYGHTTTLTMTPDAVPALIKLLAAAIDTKYTVTVTSK